MTSDIKDLSGSLNAIGTEMQALATNIISANNRNIPEVRKNDEDEKEKTNIELIGGRPSTTNLSNEHFIEEHDSSLEESIPSLVSLVAEYNSVTKAIQVQEEMIKNLLSTK